MSDVYLPVLKDTKDPHYRYKMPKLTAKIEGSGNGIKTVITNMSAVAKAIGRPPSYPTKYFGCELGAQVTIANDLYIVNGSHDPDKLLNLLYGFIKKFVLCTKCSNPETTLTISGQTIKQKCQACGYETQIPKAMHKLTTFIINHPPEGSSSAPTSGKNVKSKKNKSDKGSSEKSSSSKTKKSEPDSEINGVVCDEEDDGFDDEELSPEAIAERKRELCEGQTGIYMTDSKEIANLFYKMVKEKKEAGLLGDAQVQKELVKEAENLGMKDKAPLILCELLFSGDNMLAEIKTNRLLLLRFVTGNKKAQKYLLGGYEKLVGDVFKDKLFDKSMAVLKLFYDEDILEEEAILAWASKESKKYVGKEMSRKIHEKVAPFIKWLQEAEEEEDEDDDDEQDGDEQESDGSSSKSNDSVDKTKTTNGNGKHAANANDDDDDDDETEVEFSHRVSGITIQEVKPVVSATATATSAAASAVSAAAGANDDLDDLDIDNI